MKIILTGGGTGGHFYPLIAVTDALNFIAEQEKLVKTDIIFMSDSPYDANLLTQKGIRFKKINAGKVRRYFSIKNIPDLFKTFSGIIEAIFSVYADFPDAIFCKGGYASFPIVVAARILGIPVMVHESDVIPGKVNKWAGKFARKVAISYSSSLKYFPEKRTALTGNPVRKEFFIRATTGAKEFFDLGNDTPTLFITGGSQGSKIMNDVFLEILPSLLEKYQIIHQTGKETFEDTKGRSLIVLNDSKYKTRYHLVGSLNLSGMRMALGAADLVISRAGSGIFEIAASGLPSITIPLANSAQDHQRRNAYEYAKTGATDVIEEKNLTPNVLLSEINMLMEDEAKRKEMGAAAKKFSTPDAAEKIARGILDLVLEHS